MGISKAALLDVLSFLLASCVIFFIIFGYQNLAKSSDQSEDSLPHEQGNVMSKSLSAIKTCRDYHIDINEINEVLFGDGHTMALDAGSAYGIGIAVVILQKNSGSYYSCIVSSDGVVRVEHNEYSDSLRISLN